MNLDIIPNGAIKRVHVSQNDVGRTLTFELFNNSTSYSVPSGATVKIQGTKPSGFGFSETCTINGNVATIDTTEAMTDESGNIATELSISYNGHKIGTSNFVLAVEKNPHPDTTTDGSMETIIPELTLLVNEVKGYAEEIEGTYHAYGSPWVASTVAEMTDTDKIYVYVGSESGYTKGNWYYYNGTAWVSGGVYNSVAVQTDTTLSVSGMPADAKAVGDEVGDLRRASTLAFEPTTLDFTVGKQLSANGALYDNVHAIATTNFIYAKKGSMVSNLASGTYTMFVSMYSDASIGSHISTVEYRDFTMPYDGYIRVSIGTNDSSDATVELADYVEPYILSKSIEKDIENIEDSINCVWENVFEPKELTFTVGKQLSANGALYDNVHAIATTNFIYAKKGSKVILTDSEYTLLIAEYASANISSFISYSEITETFVVEENEYIRLSIATGDGSTATLDIASAISAYIMSDALESDIKANSADINTLNEYTGYETHGFVFEVGALVATTAVETDNSARARCGYLPVKKGDIVQITNPNYQLMVFEFTTNERTQNYTHNNSSVNFVYEDYEVQNDDVAYVRIVVKRADNVNITDDDIAELSNCISIVSLREDLPKHSVEAVPVEVFTTDYVPHDDNTYLTYDEIIQGYDDLVENYPDYVTKNTLGIDSSGNYTIYQYVFEPKGTPKVTYNFNGKTYDIPTIILEAGVHGSERPIVKGLLNAMALICEKWSDNPVLAYLRFNYRFVVNPCAVPYGYQGQGGRFNANGVNINRNFNGMDSWQYGSGEIGNANYRGEYPLSEIEAQYIYNTLASNKDAILYHSYHTYGMMQSYSAMMCWSWATYIKPNEMYVAGENILKQISRNAWAKHNYPYSNGTLIGQMQASNGINAFASYRGGYTCNMGNAFGIPSACPEGIYHVFGDSSTEDSHDINCINAEFVIITVIEALRQLT